MNKIMNYVASITPEHNTLVLNLKELFSINSSVDIKLSTVGVSLDDVFINSVSGCDSMTISTSPYIVTLRVNFNADNYKTGTIELSVGDKSITISVDDYDVQRLQNTENECERINSKLETFMLLRTNPKLSGNIKLVVDSEYHLFLDTFKVSSMLNKRIYRKYPISSEGNYPFDVMIVFSNLPKSELFKLPNDSLNPHKFYNDYTYQYNTEYEYGALTNDDNLYSENMKILAPLHIGKHIPDFFVIFRYDDIVDSNDTSKFNTLLKQSEIVKIFDLRNYTTIGQYLNNYAESIKEYLYGSCYMQFIEQDNEKYGSNYRQGNNSWRGIDISKGIITNMIETSYFANNILEKENGVQELFNNYIINGYERNNVLYPYIINLEFMFDDNMSDEFSIHNYFGLYMSSNEIIHYDCIISDNVGNNLIKKKLDKNDNIINDNDIIKNMFIDNYKDRMFFMSTNNDVMRVLSLEDVSHFVSKNVLDNPDKMICSLNVDKMVWNDELSFITMTFDEPIHYGEHLRFIAMNIKNNINNEYENICLEIIASNDERLRYTDNFITPYISTNTPYIHECVTSNKILNNIYRLSFYTQSLSDSTVCASLSELFKRIKSCINKFNSFIDYKSSNENTISFISTFDNVYFQHISIINKYKEPEYEQLYIDNKVLYYTGDRNSSYINSLKPFLSGMLFENNNKNYIYNNVFHSDKKVSKVTTFVNYEENTQKDTIHYFTKTSESMMYPISPDTYYFNNSFGVFSLYGYEILGWRYNNIVLFKKIEDFKNPYIVHNECENNLKNIKHPLIKTSDKKFEVIRNIKNKSGYITDNSILELDIDSFDIHTQKIVLNEYNSNIIINPYNVDKNIIDLNNQAYIHNNQLNIYNPESASINVMGIYNIKDIDMSINYNQAEKVSSDDVIVIPKGTIFDINNSDESLISKGIVYQILKGGFNEFSALNFVILGNKLYTTNNDGVRFESDSLTVSSDLYIKSINGNCELKYNFCRNIPILKSENFYKDSADTKNSNLYIPIVPLTNCLWKSNGLYFDQNSVLNTDELINTYNQVGYFTEYFNGLSKNNEIDKYVKNSIDSFVNIDGSIHSFKDLIINGNIKKPLKKMLIQNKNIDTAICYYDTYIQSLEFIYYGIKFSIKFNSDYYALNLRTGEYNNFEVYIINDYNVLKNNEIYISVDEDIILFINHKYDIYNLKKLYNQLFYLKDKNFVAPYSVYPAPYSIYTDSLCSTKNNIVGAKTLLNYIILNDNMSDVFYVQDDKQHNDNDLPNYIYFNVNNDAVDNKNNILVKSNSNNIGCLYKNYSKYSVVSYSESLTNNELWTKHYHKYDSYIISKIKTTELNIDYNILTKYIKTFDVNYDCYIINDGLCENIDINEYYKPLSINLLIPNKIKYHFGYFTPYFYDIIEFKPNDYELQESLNMNLLLGNTKFQKVNSIKTYTGNKVFSLNTKVDTNYFIINNKSVMNSNWNDDYYRNYDSNNQETFKYIPGYILGVSDKSFFGSHCITLISNHIDINDFSYKRSMKQSLKQVVSNNNKYSKNTKQYTFAINITLSIYNFFQNNDVFINNWKKLTKDINTSMKNYIQNTLSKIFNILRNIEINIYKKESDVLSMSLQANSINDYTDWILIEGYETKFSVENNELILTIVINEYNNSIIHPQIKISRI